MVIKNHRIRKVHVPKRLIFNKQLFEIVNLNKKFVIIEYKIKTVDGKIDSVFINCPHPNANPRTGEFCIPHSIRSLEYNENTVEMIDTMLCCFNLDDCYFTPWDEIEYKRNKVIGAWERKTE